MSDTPKFSLLGHLKEKQNVESPKPTQTVNTGTSGVPRFKPAAGVVIPGLKVEHRASEVSSSEIPPAETALEKSLDSGNGGQDVSVGQSTSLVAKAPGGLTHQLEAMKLRAEAGKKALDALYITEHHDFNTLLERLDSLFDEDLGLDDFNVQPARDIVEVIMKQLKEDPNLDGMMIDKDAANIIAFVRKVKGVAIEVATTKKEKATKKVENASKKSVARFDSSLLDKFDFSVPVSKSPTSIADLSNIDVDKLKF